VEYLGLFDKGKEMMANKKDEVKIKDFYNKLSASKEDKATYHHKWNRYCRVYKGDQWDEKRPSWKASAVNNISFALIESMLPLLLDGDPVILTEPQTEEDRDASEKINLILKNIWNKLRLKAEYTQSIRDSLKLGTGLIRVGWDSDALNGMGEISAKSVDPYDVFVDPNATSFDNAEYLIYRTKLSLNIIKNKYDNGKSVVSDLEYFNDENSRETPTKNGRKESTIATVYEEWTRVPEGMRLRVFASGLLLEEKMNPFELNTRFPFIGFFNYKLTGELWGYSELANLEPLQKEQNKIRSLIVDNLQTTANNVWIVDSTAGIEKGQITSKPGQVIYKSPNGKVERVQGSSLPTALYEQLSQIQSSMEYTSGIFPISFGVSPGSVTAGTSLSILTENAQTRIRGKLRSFEDGLSELGEWFVSLIRQFYTEPRVIKLTGDEGFTFQTFDNSSLRQEQEELDEEGNVVNKTTLLVEFDINVIPGSSLRVNRSARYQQAMEMYNAGALDPETLIERAEIGDTKQIIDRLIKYGKLADPNDPQIKIDRIIKGITDRISFNVSSTDPTIVQSALQEILENEKLLANQLGVPNENLEEGQDLKARGLGKLTAEEEAMKKEEEAMGGMAPEGQAPVSPEEDPEMMAKLEEMAKAGIPPEEAMAILEQEMAGGQSSQAPQPQEEMPQQEEQEMDPEMMAMMEELAKQGVPQEEAMAMIEEQMAGGQAPQEQQGQVQPEAPQDIDPQILAQLEEMVKSGMSPEEAIASLQATRPEGQGGSAEGEEQTGNPIDEQTMAILEQLVEQGVPEETMEQIVQMLQQGMPIEEIIKMLQGEE
jgi:hypothetical protein